MISNAFDFLPEDYSPDSPFPPTPEATNPNSPPIYDTPRRLTPQEPPLPPTYHAPTPPPRPSTPPRTYKASGAVSTPQQPPLPPPPLQQQT